VESRCRRPAVRVVGPAAALPIIPPSIIMVIYAITDSKVTVAGLFLASVVPGVLMAGPAC
jgi:TRAP-type C4-dicarboxylate transport system permease large subunit